MTVLQKSEGAPTVNDVLRPGKEMVAAGYALYGSATMVVLSTGEGVHGFTLDPVSSASLFIFWSLFPRNLDFLAGDRRVHPDAPEHALQVEGLDLLDQRGIREDVEQGTHRVHPHSQGPRAGKEGRTNFTFFSQIDDFFSLWASATSDPWSPTCTAPFSTEESSSTRPLPPLPMERCVFSNFYGFSKNS